MTQIHVQKIATVLSFWEAIFALERIILLTYVQEIKTAGIQTCGFSFLHLFDIIFVRINVPIAKKYFINFISLRIRFIVHELLDFLSNLLHVLSTIKFS